MATAKATAVAAKLASEIQVRLPTAVVTSSLGTAKDPLIVVAQDSSWATTEDYILIRIISLPSEASSLNIFGGLQTQYANHIIQVGMESTGGATTPDKRSTVQVDFMLSVLQEVFKQGIVTEIYHTDTTTKPIEASFALPDTTTHLFVKSIHPNLWWPTQIGQ